jgi:L-fuculose-phosphate aldolase
MYSSNEFVLRNELTRISRRTYERGLSSGTGGNTSIRLDGQNMLIKASGVSLLDTAADNLIKANYHTLEWEPNLPYKPSKEYRFHAAIYRHRPDVDAIVHCHPPYATSYLVREMKIPYVTDVAMHQPPMPHVPHLESGSAELYQAVEKAIVENPNCKVVLLYRHGIIAMAGDIVSAYNLADLTEDMAKIAYISSTIPAQ